MECYASCPVCRQFRDHFLSHQFPDRPPRLSAVACPLLAHLLTNMKAAEDDGDLTQQQQLQLQQELQARLQDLLLKNTCANLLLRNEKTEAFLRARFWVLRRGGGAANNDAVEEDSSTASPSSSEDEEFSSNKFLEQACVGVVKSLDSSLEEHRKFVLKEWTNELSPEEQRNFILFAAPAAPPEASSKTTQKYSADPRRADSSETTLNRTDESSVLDLMPAFVSAPVVYSDAFLGLSPCPLLLALAQLVTAKLLCVLWGVFWTALVQRHRDFFGGKKNRDLLEAQRMRNFFLAQSVLRK